MKLASFDIFDTTLIRKCGLPQNIFYLLSMRLFADNEILREGFLSWRTNIESQIRRTVEGEVSLEKIYSYAYLLGDCKYSSREMMEEEIQVEKENLIANPSVVELIKRKRDEGFTICFISDMYLGSETLFDILKSNGCICINEKIFVSCEYNARKSDGTLYDIVRKEYEPTTWEHYGDNKHSDVKSPKKKGINATYINTLFSEPENEIIRESVKRAYRYELSIFAGLQRASRIIHKDTAEVKLAADFVAPFYIPYIFYMLGKSKELGLKRLYFLSRDAYIIKKIAEVFSDYFKDIELKYLYVSRRSLLFPYLKDITEEKLLNIFPNRTLRNCKVENILAYLETDIETLKDRYGIEFPYKEISSIEEEKDFLHKVFDRKGRLLSHLNEKATNRYNLLRTYFIQEGLFDNVLSGMADVGWLGTTRLMINDILQRENQIPAHFFYLDTEDDVIQQRYGSYSAFLGTGLIYRSLSFVENYCSLCPHPSCNGYKLSPNSQQVVPSFKEERPNKDVQSIVENNYQVSQWIASHLLELNLPIKEVGKDWTIISACIFEEYPKTVDFSPLTKIDNFDLTVVKGSISFVRKLSLVELVRFVFLGTSFTAFNRASLRCTVGNKIDSILWRISKRMFTYKMRLLRKYPHIKDFVH